MDPVRPALPDDIVDRALLVLVEDVLEVAEEASLDEVELSAFFASSNPTSAGGDTGLLTSIHKREGSNDEALPRLSQNLTKRPEAQNVPPVTLHSTLTSRAALAERLTPPTPMAMMRAHKAFVVRPIPNLIPATTDQMIAW